MDENEIFGQMMRYGDGIFSDDLLKVFEILVDINDDFWHDRDAGQHITEAITALKKLEEGCTGRNT